jgi:hypothetical protein
LHATGQSKNSYPKILKVQEWEVNVWIKIKIFFLIWSQTSETHTCLLKAPCQDVQMRSWAWNQNSWIAKWPWRHAKIQRVCKPVEPPVAWPLVPLGS